MQIVDCVTPGSHSVTTHEEERGEDETCQASISERVGLKGLSRQVMCAREEQAREHNCPAHREWFGHHKADLKHSNEDRDEQQSKEELLVDAGTGRQDHVIEEL